MRVMNKRVIGRAIVRGNKPPRRQLAPNVGLEPTTLRLRVSCSTQSVEHETLNLRVVGSSPTLGANCRRGFFFPRTIALPITLLFITRTPHSEDRLFSSYSKESLRKKAPKTTRMRTISMQACAQQQEQVR